MGSLERPNLQRSRNLLNSDCDPERMTSAVHDRMPVILDPESYDIWLDPGMRDVAEASELLKPYDARRMRCYRVSTRINHVANDDAECSTPVELAEIQNHLFVIAPFPAEPVNVIGYPARFLRSRDLRSRVIAVATNACAQADYRLFRHS
jgi:hypothetical protein